jgi:hypothetical protein
MASSIDQLGAVLRGERNRGKVTFRIHVLGRPVAPYSVEVVDAFVMRLGFRALADGWREVEAHEAARVVQHILHCDLAYDLEIMPEARAAELTIRFLELFSAPTRYFTNATFRRDAEVNTGEVWRMMSWEPLSTATFDTGVVCVDATRIGILWVADED